MISINYNLKINIINFFLLLLPLTFILGNSAVNLNIIVLIITTIAVFRGKIFEMKFSYIDKIILIFFTYIIFSSVLINFFNLNSLEETNKNFLLIKSLAFFRFLLLYFTIKFLALNNAIKFKLLFFIFGAFGLFVSIDIIVQHFFGKDLLGYEGYGRRLSGPFKDEYIAGAYIQRFLIFIILSIILFQKKKETFTYYFLISSIFFIGLFGISFSGNRMPLIMFLLMSIIFFSYQKIFRKFLVICLIVFLSASFYLVNNNKNYLYHYMGFIQKSFQIMNYFKTKITGSDVEFIRNVYIKEFETGILTWEENKIFGGGIKSFYFNCEKIETPEMKKTKNCNSHPHNYYLQIAAETGLIGLIIVIYLFSIIFFESLKFLYFTKKYNKEKLVLITCFTLFIVEIFPLKTTGSFFTTFTSSYMFILIPLIVSIIDKKKLQL